ncbi:MAG: DoxX family protein [Pseudomonadota bacterium]
MSKLVSIHNAVFDRLEALLAPWLIPSLARLVFAGTLLMYFWASGLTKLGDGIFGFIRLSDGVYIQMFPRVFEQLGYDPSAFGIGYRLIALFGTWAEFILPLLIVLGLFTRLAAIGMIGFVVVMSITDILGHSADAETVGTWFDRASGSLIIDQRAFWIFLLLVLVLRGAGPISLDRFVLRPRIAI